MVLFMVACITALSFAWQLQIRVTIICTQANFNCSLATMQFPSIRHVAVRPAALLSWAQAAVQDPLLMDQSNYSLMTPMLALHRLHNNTGECILGNAFTLSSALHRYPIQKPELGCYGHRESVRGVRNYGKRDASELFDVYCFASIMQGEMTETGTVWWCLLLLLYGCLLC